MTTKAEGGPDYPEDAAIPLPAVVDMRDYFAAAALMGYRAHGDWQQNANPNRHPSNVDRVATPQAVAIWSYADAMLAERAK